MNQVVFLFAGILSTWSFIHLIGPENRKGPRLTGGHKPNINERILP